MTDYGFRLRLLLAPDRFIDHEGQYLTFSVVKERLAFELQSIGAKRISESRTLDFIAKGFLSEEDAAQKGTRLQYSLMLTCACLGIGITFNPERSSGTTEELKRRRNGQRVYGPEYIKYGLTTFKNNLEHGPSLSNIHLTSYEPSERFIRMLGDFWNKNPNPTAKQQLALEIVCLSEFEFSPRAQYISLATSLEALATRHDRKKEEIDYLKRIIEYSNNIGTNASLLDAMKSLKKESISSSCKKLIKQYLGESRVVEFSELYNIRSRILHSGEIPETVDLMFAQSKLKRLVMDLLIRMIIQ